MPPRKKKASKMKFEKDSTLKRRVGYIFRQSKRNPSFKHNLLVSKLAELDNINAGLNRLCRKKKLTSKEKEGFRKLESRARVLVKDISAKWARIEKRDVFEAGPD